jgi:hypothetical protein
MAENTLQPRVFISYSWTTPQHEKWVLELAQRLSSDGVSVVLDKWDLREGQDKHAFMEQMVHDQQITKVLVICDSGYQEKANDRKGGVGTETQLISKEVYDKTGQERFIPVVTELDDEGKPCIPHFMGSRIYIDLSSEKIFEENYQKLVRNLYGRPLLKRPPLGSPPAYLLEEVQVLPKTHWMLGSVKDALLNDKPSADGLVGEFLRAFASSLEDFRLTGGAILGFDDKVIESIERMLPLRDSFIEFISALFTYRSTVDLDRLHASCEELIAYTFRPESVQSWTEVDFDNYRFFNYEFMLTFVAALLKLRRYREVGYLMHTPYFHRGDMRQLRNEGIQIFNRYVRSLDEFRNNRLGLHRVSITADVLRSRATYQGLDFQDVREADLILHYVTSLRNVKFAWFPRTSAYGGRGGGIELFDRLVSVRHFEKVKAIFDVGTIDELKALIDQTLERDRANPHASSPELWNYDIRPLERVIDVPNIGTIR